MNEIPLGRTLMDTTHRSETQLKSAHKGQHSTQESETQLKFALQFFLIFLDNSERKSARRILFY